jgi:hypothetical protein
MQNLIPQETNFNGSQFMVIKVKIGKSFTLVITCQTKEKLFETCGYFASARVPYGFILHPNEGSNTFSVYIYSSETYVRIGGNFPVLDPTSPNTYGMSYDHQQKKAFVYLNGAIIHEKEIDIYRESSNIEVEIGRDNCGERIGKMKAINLFIYDKCLSENEILYLYKYQNRKNPFKKTYKICPRNISKDFTGLKDHFKGNEISEEMENCLKTFEKNKGVQFEKLKFESLNDDQKNEIDIWFLTTGIDYSEEEIKFFKNKFKVGK